MIEEVTFDNELPVNRFHLRRNKRRLGEIKRSSVNNEVHSVTKRPKTGESK